MKSTPRRYDLIASSQTEIPNTFYWFRQTEQDADGFHGLERSTDGKEWMRMDLEELYCAKQFAEQLLARHPKTSAGYDPLSLIRSAFE